MATALPDFNPSGDLLPGIYPLSLAEVIAHFGARTPQRSVLASRLSRIYALAKGTGHLARLMIFGSFVTAKPAPNDLDLFLLMEDSFDASQIAGETATVFDHPAAQNYFGASVFWVRRLAALGGEAATVEHWQIKRDGDRRGIVEVI